MEKEVAGNPEEADKSGILARYRIICISYGNPGGVDAFCDVVELTFTASQIKKCFDVAKEKST